MVIAVGNMHVTSGPTPRGRVGEWDGSVGPIVRGSGRSIPVKGTGFPSSTCRSWTPPYRTYKKALYDGMDVELYLLDQIDH